MDTRKAYTQKREAELQEWSKKIDQLSARVERANEETRAKLQDQVRTLERTRNEARTKLDELRNAGDQAWDDVKDGVENAWHELRSAIESAGERLTKVAS